MNGYRALYAAAAVAVITIVAGAAVALLVVAKSEADAAAIITILVGVCGPTLAALVAAFQSNSTAHKVDQLDQHQVTVAAAIDSHSLAISKFGDQVAGLQARVLGNGTRATDPPAPSAVQPPPQEVRLHGSPT